MAKINVVTTTEDIASIVREVGGNRVAVQSIARGYQDPHVVEAKPSYMLKINRADLLAYQGLELEVGWLPLLIQGGRNKKVMPGQLGHLDVSHAITPLEVPAGQLDRSMGDVHPLGNPHYTLNPENGLLIAAVIAERLSQLDPSGSQSYQANLEKFRQRLKAKVVEWKSRLEKFKGSKVVTYHTTWSYLLDFFKIESVGAIENRPGIPPSGRHLAELATLMNQTGTKVILQANYFDDEFSQLLASKTEATVLALPVAVGGTEEAQDTFTLFEILVDKLEKAFAKHQSLIKKENH
ncbi:MAG: adhesin [Nitrospinaceae bacterium]|nr:MAG: adhesin [Nitrospinaceae bacterium]